jgi:asparagine synthase (glutamine-hydrolysing)
MCGICGMFETGQRRAARAIDEETLGVMTDLMTHRGPDDHGLHLGDGVAIGARRLSIIDVDGGHQPSRTRMGPSGPRSTASSTTTWSEA